MTRNRFKAVLFDMDGVLIDSLPVHVKSWQYVFKDYYIDIEPLEILEREGEKAEETGRIIAGKRGLKLSTQELAELLRKKRAFYAEHAPKGILPGADELLKLLKSRGCRLALVTGSILKNLDRVLKKEEKELFDTIVTSDIVKNSKPHPEPFLTAARNLFLDRQDCVVIENAPLGIEAAKSADMKVIAITSTLEKKYLKGADWVVESLSEILEIIEIQGENDVDD